MLMVCLSNNKLWNGVLVTGRDADRPGNSGSGVACLLVSPFVIIDHVRACARCLSIMMRDTLGGLSIKINASSDFRSWTHEYGIPARVLYLYIGCYAVRMLSKLADLFIITTVSNIFNRSVFK